MSSSIVVSTPPPPTAGTSSGDQPPLATPTAELSGQKHNGRTIAQIGWYEEDPPKPPIPSLERTFERYLQYAQVIAECAPLRGENNGEAEGTVSELSDIDAVNMAVSRFFPFAEKLQNEIRVLAEMRENWINDFWLLEMYLKQRMPLPVNFNPAYVFPTQHFRSDDDQLNYTAWVIRGIMEFRQRVDTRTLPRDVNSSRRVTGAVPMCMAQYDRLLDCYREPALGVDIQHNRRQTPDAYYADAASEHVIVMCEQQAFVVFVRVNGRMLKPHEIVAQLRTVVARATNRDVSTVASVGGATCGNRDDAAKFWTIMKEASINVSSLNWIRAAVFVVCLDRNRLLQPSELASSKDEEEEPLFIDELESAGLQILHGFGSAHFGLNRWFDATIQLIVSRSGTNGLCIEHSVAEGIVIINMAESALRYANNGNWQSSGNCQPQFEGTGNQPSSALCPRPLSWALNEEAQRILDGEIGEFDRLVNDLQLRVMCFEKFGKALIKSLRVSPDGFVQLAMQLAHYRSHGYLVSTYESATMRKFRGGRVDNIRAATPEALRWTRSMCDPFSGRETRLTLLREAFQKQAIVTYENVNGNGIDNHLCALEVLTRAAKPKATDMPELFRQRMWSELMRFPLSTSQVTTSADFADCYLFYGPVVPDGYGCAYNVQNARIWLVASAFRSNRRTDVDAFRANLAVALTEMRDLMMDAE